MKFVHDSSNPQSPVTFASFEAMHTVFEMIVVGKDGPVAEELASSVRSLVQDLQGGLDRHADGSEFFRVNASRGTAPVSVSPEIFRILQECERFRAATLGYFDIAALSPRTSARQHPYTLDEAARTVLLGSGEVMLDAGAFGKGLALDKAVALLGDAGVDCALLNFGDSSVRAIGHHPFGASWQVALRKGDATFSLKDSSLSVSGLHPDGTAHIVDPLSGNPVCDRAVMAVTGESALVCEVLSTALYAAPSAVRDKIISNFPGCHFFRIDE